MNSNQGESVSAVVLKRLEDAEMDNDNILAVIDGKLIHFYSK